MTIVEGLFISGRIVDLMLLLLLVEAVVILIFRRRTGRGIAALPLLANLGAGGSLVLAWRAEVAGAGWTWVGGFLVMALAFHVLDLVLRWGRPVPAGPSNGDGT